MKFDEILDFLFRTRRGLGVLAFSTLAGALLTGGCLCSDTSCVCGGGACGCTVCSDGSGCSVCSDCFDTCGKDLCTCGGFCSSSGCAGGSTPTYYVDATYINASTGETMGSKSFRFSSRKDIKKYDPGQSQLDGYIDFQGFYGSFSNGVFSEQITDDQGDVLDGVETENYVQLYAKCAELYYGETRQIEITAKVVEEDGGYADLDVEIPVTAVTVGATIETLPTLPDIDGMTFSYWRMEDTGNQFQWKNGDTFHLYTYRIDQQELVLEVSAVYTYDKYDISFRVDANKYSLQGVTYGTTASELQEMYDSKYPDTLNWDSSRQFVGWSRQADVYDPFTADDIVTEQCTLYAFFREYRTVTLHFTQGPDSDVTQEKTYLSGEAVELPVYGDVGRYTFRGWYYDAELTRPVEAGDLLSASDLYAKWYAPDEYTVYYYLKQGDSAYLRTTYSYSDTQEYDLQAVTDSALIEKGYTFAGWCREEDLSDEPVMQLPAGTYGDLKLYACFLPMQFTVLLNAGSGSVSEEEQTLTYGERFTLPVPTRTGYDFVGWFLINGTQCTDGSGNSLEAFGETMLGAASSDNSLQLIARWTDQQCTLSFFNDDGTLFAKTTVLYGTAPGTVEQLETSPVKRGHTFAGWFDSEGRAFDEEQVVTGNLSFLARFTPNEYTITLDANGGTIGGEESAQVKITFGTSISLGVPEREGYVFIGWYDEEGNEIASFNGEMKGEYDEDRNVTLYAHWVSE